MRNVRSIIFAVLLTAAGAFAASAAEQATAPAPGAGAGNRPAGAPGAAPTEQQFNEMKSRMLKTLDMRRKELDEQKACVKGAKNMDDLRKCRAERMMRPDRPKRPEGRRQGNMERQQTPPPAGGNQ